MFVRPPVGEQVLVATDERSPELAVRLAGAIAAADQGVVVPFAVSTADAAGDARGYVDAAATAASALGYDVDGRLRLDDSTVDGTLQLSAEHGASLLLLPWRARPGDVGADGRGLHGCRVRGPGRGARAS